MITKPKPRTAEVRMKQLVDWSAAVWAGVVAGLVYLLITFFVHPLVVGGNGWFFVRYMASIPMGESVLAPTATFDLLITVVALVSHLVLSVIFSMVLAYIIHRGGLLNGMVLGAVFGLALYIINYYTLTLVFPWFFALRSWVLAYTHMFFGAMAGGLYESLGVEEFVPEESS